MYKTLWRNNTNIRYYLLARSISQMGDVLSGMAFLFLTYDLTASSIHTTGMAIAEVLPYLLFGLIGGVVADWVPKKKLLIFLDLIRIPLVCSIVCLHYFGMLTYPYLLIVSFLIQSIGCFFNPAHRAMLPLITSPNERTSVNSLYDTLTRGVTVISPVLSVWLLNSFGAVQFFTVDALTYAISSFCMTQITLIEHHEATHRSIKSVFQAIFEFATWMRKQITIKQLFLFTGITVFFNTWVWEVGLLLALSELTTQSEKLYSILQGVFGGVVIIANIIIPYCFKKLTLQHYLIGALVWGIGITYYGLLYGIPHFFIGCSIVGLGLPLAGLARVYLLQSLVPSEKMGRAFSFNAVVLYFSNTISLGLYGFLVLIFPIQNLIIFSGILIVLVCTLGLVLASIKRTKSSRRSTVNFFK